MSDEPEEEYDSAGTLMAPSREPDWMKEPATRGELLQVASMIHLALTSHSIVENVTLNGDEAKIRAAGIRAVEANGEILNVLQKFLNRWARL